MSALSPLAQTTNRDPSSGSSQRPFHFERLLAWHGVAQLSTRGCLALGYLKDHLLRGCISHILSQMARLFCSLTPMVGIFQRGRHDQNCRLSCPNVGPNYTFPFRADWNLCAPHSSPLVCDPVFWNQLSLRGVLGGGGSHARRSQRMSRACCLLSAARG
jgi:hypothetical protein